MEAADNIIRCSAADGQYSEWRAIPHPDGNGWQAQFRNNLHPGIPAERWLVLQQPSWHPTEQSALEHCVRQLEKSGWQIVEGSDTAVGEAVRDVGMPAKETLAAATK